MADGPPFDQECDCSSPLAKEISDFQRLALERLEALPGVVSASISWSVPFLGLTESRKYLIEGHNAPKPDPLIAAISGGAA